MIYQIAKYMEKMVARHLAHKDMIAFAAQDDKPVYSGNPDLLNTISELLPGSGAVALLSASPLFPFAELLLKRAPLQHDLIVPLDTETRTFLHDIPLLRKSGFNPPESDEIAHLLGKRKGIIVEGAGIITTGNFTVEQAYANWSSIYHATFVKYLGDILLEGFILPEEKNLFEKFRIDNLLFSRQQKKTDFRKGELSGKETVVEEMVMTGKWTVESGLVDSFFGNISYFDGKRIFISETAASLDELEGCIDIIPLDNSSTAGITASSELAAHRGIYETCNVRAILHGHPGFSVIMSILCEERENCDIDDCWKDCRRERKINGIPVIAGETGAGGLAETLPRAIAEAGSAIVYGHGVFTAGRRDFGEAFWKLKDIEDSCMKEYFRRFDEKYTARGKT